MLSYKIYLGAFLAQWFHIITISYLYNLMQYPLDLEMAFIKLYLMIFSLFLLQT